MLTLLLLGPILAPQSGAQDLGAEVRTLLAAKCVACHHPESDSRKAQREFDGMRDMGRVIDELGGGGVLLDSDLWYTVEMGDMPPDDSDVEPLTEAELESIRAWIEAGTPEPQDGDLVIPLAGATQAGTEPQDPQDPQDPLQGEESEAEGTHEEAQEAEQEAPVQKYGARVVPPFLERLERFGARLHPASTHFPVALLLVAALARLCGSRREDRMKLRAAEGYCLLLGLLGAGAATGLGLLAEIHGSPDPDTAQIHKWLAFGTTGAALLLVMLRPFAVRSKAYSWLLVLCALSVAVTGHFGGELAWGDDGPRLRILFPELNAPELSAPEGS